MTLTEYAAFVEEMWISHPRDESSPLDRQRSLMIMSLGLGGEAGEVQEHIKKFVRDGKLNLNDLTFELGDLIYYWTKLCNHFQLKPEDVLKANITKLTDRMKRNVLHGSGDHR
jgi:NTP pyrophosphatase (non-canonical NTP hydrolase)